MITFDDEKEEQELAEIRQKEEEDFVREQAAKTGFPFIDLMPISIETDALSLLPEQEARNAEAVPFSITGKKVAVAAFAPGKEKSRRAVEKLRQAGYSPTVFMASHKGLEKVFNLYRTLSTSSASKTGAVELGEDAISRAAASIKTLSESIPLIEQLIRNQTPNRISELVELILGTAIAVDASDIHLEPEEPAVRLRFRLDGVLQETLAFDGGTYALLNSRIKLLSGLKLNIKNQAQDGRFSVRLKDADIEIRASVLPGAYGESIVLRVLNPKTIAVPLEELGMHAVLRSLVEESIARPNGMILTTGPTGSGKTTTLYAFLRKIYTPGIKIITIEDPIEYHLRGITQTQTDAAHGYTFVSGLRSALRQDPDVMMVGEIRDEETAGIAVNASLTGHLVFSTLHTNNAAGAFPRLIDLGVNPKVIVSAITLAMAQRLVRKLCPACKKERALDGADKDLIEFIVNALPHGVTPAQTEKIWVPGDCARCNNTGYRGRTGVYEAIRADSAIEKVVRENPSEREIAAAARPQNIPDMAQDGVLKVLSGITSLEELKRVVILSQ